MTSATADQTDSPPERSAPRETGSQPSRFIKPKKCRVCRRPYEPRNTLQACCSPSCAVAYARLGGEKRQSLAMKRVAMAEKRETRERLKTRRDWLREAQAAFNAWVRERDWNRPCISCGSTSQDWTRGGSWDCGHYRSVGAAPELRFEPKNAHKQCKQCNRHMSGNVVEFRFGLSARIGQDGLAWLEGPHEPKKYTADELKQMILGWRKETRELRVRHVLGPA